MNVGINTALSGFQAAQKRLEAASSNIANQFSTRTRDQDGVETVAPPPVLEVVQSSQAEGGVRAEIRGSDRAPFKAFDPQNPDADENGQVSTPRVDTAEEIVKSKIATYDAQANLKSIKVQDDLFKSLLDITT